MVTVKFEKRGNHLYAESTGHATGNPVVCAGVSGVMSVLSAVARESKESDGRYTALLGQDEGSRTVFYAVRHTMDRMALTYPDLVTVKTTF